MTGQRTQEYLDQIELRAGASNDAIAALETELGTRLPEDYLAFLHHSNGGIGLGPDLFVNITAAEDVGATTRAYGRHDAYEFVPGLVIIGNDGLGNVLGIDARACDTSAMEYVLLDACNLGWGEVGYRTDSFHGLLAYLALRTS